MICLFCNLSEVFICVSNFHFENNKGSLFFRCNGNEVIVIVAISSYSSFGSQVNLYDGQLFILSHVRIMKVTAVSS